MKTKKIIGIISIAIILSTHPLLPYEFDFLNTTKSDQTVEWSLSGCSTAGAVEELVPKGLVLSGAAAGAVGGAGGPLALATGVGFGPEVVLGVAGVGTAITIGLTAAAAATNQYLPEGCHASFKLKPGEWSTVKASGRFAGYCVDTVKAGDHTWKGSKCHNQGFTIDDNGVHTHGGKVYVYTFNLVNESPIPVTVNAKVLVIKQGLKEIKTTLQPKPAKLTPPTASSSKEEITQYALDLQQASAKGIQMWTGLGNVIRIDHVDLKGPNDTKYSIYLGDTVLSGNLTLTIKLDTKKQLYCTDGDGKTYYPWPNIKVNH